MLLPSFDKLAFLTLFGLINLAIVNVGAMPPRGRLSLPSSSARGPVSSEPIFVGYAYEDKDNPGNYLDYSVVTRGVAVFSVSNVDTTGVLEDCWKCLVYDEGFFADNQMRLLFVPPRIKDTRGPISKYIYQNNIMDPEEAILVQEYEGGEVMLIPQAIFNGPSPLRMHCPKEGESDYKAISNTKWSTDWKRLGIKHWDENPKYLTPPNGRPHPSAHYQVDSV
ncbi:hypothetical protein F5050DRAFT_1714279 [Lentinula boryana]|uniref:Uncharacterized protein n=1 Tax=Lentinula boryana TaxID=40481 RepID=A0ABQ8Q5D6_9AGAR|nr:hypothetical protein F5050DRAFT_1714279 [Lentinula boryana]